MRADAETQVEQVEGYGALLAVLQEAYNQSARGKGHDRHANGRAFEQQPILEIGRMVGPGFATGQVMKKAQEAASMAARGEVGAAVRELLGVIVYAASAVVLVREGRRPGAVDAPADPDVKTRCYQTLADLNLVHVMEAPEGYDAFVGWCAGAPTGGHFQVSDAILSWMRSPANLARTVADIDLRREALKADRSFKIGDRVQAKGLADSKGTIVKEEAGGFRIAWDGYGKIGPLIWTSGQLTHVN